MTVVFFDGVCNFCNSWVLRLLRWDKKQQFTFSSLQSNYARQTLVAKGLNEQSLLDGIVLLENGALFHKSKAVFRIARLLGFPFSIFSVCGILPTFITDFLYDIIAKNRYRWFGKKEKCMLPGPEIKSRFID